MVAKQVKDSASGKHRFYSLENLLRLFHIEYNKGYRSMAKIMSPLERQNKPKIPSPEDIELAAASKSILTGEIDLEKQFQELKIKQNGSEEWVKVPSSAYQLLIDILAQISQGNGVAIVPVKSELTTQQAANLLNVSRPYLIKLLESEKIPYRQVGKHRRILARDLYQYKNQIDRDRERTLDELTYLTEELGLYDD